MYSSAMYVLFFYVMTLFTSHCIHVLVICADYNFFDVPVLDVLCCMMVWANSIIAQLLWTLLLANYFLLIILCGEWLCESI
jgi:hypothetical protein